MRKNVLIPIANDSEETETIAVADCLRRAGAIVILAAISKIEVKFVKGTKIIADKLISECQNEIFDLIVLPGGLPGAEYLRDNSILTQLLKEQAASGRFYAGICAAPVTILQYHNLLQNKKATCHPAMRSELNNFVSDRVVVDGNCITSQGPGTALEFALKLIELLYNKEHSQKIANAIVF